jgi:hypothetical protein
VLPCEISGSQSCIDKNPTPAGCYVAFVFRVKNSVKNWMLDREEEVITVLRNVGNCLSFDMA